MLDVLLYYWNMLGQHKNEYIYMLLVSVAGNFLKMFTTIYHIMILDIVYRYRMKLTTIFWFMLAIHLILMFIQFIIAKLLSWLLRQELWFYRYLFRKHWNVVLKRIINNASLEWIMENSSHAVAKKMASVAPRIYNITRSNTFIIKGLSQTIIICLISLWTSIPLFLCMVLILVLIGTYMHRYDGISLDLINQFKINMVEVERCMDNVMASMMDTVLNNVSEENDNTILRYVDNKISEQGRVRSRVVYNFRSLTYDVTNWFIGLQYLVIIMFAFMTLNNFEKFIALLLWIRAAFNSFEAFLNDLFEYQMEMKLFTTDFYNLESVYQATSVPRKAYRQLQISPGFELRFERCSFEYIPKRDAALHDEKPEEKCEKEEEKQADKCFAITLKTPMQFKLGDVVEINGESGSGKTTLLKLMRSIHHSNDVILTYRNDPSARWKKLPSGWHNLSDSICFCQQNASVFANGTLGQIISGVFDGPFDTELVNVAIKTANVPEHLIARDNITPSQISGGEKQRISIARIVYRILKQSNKNIIILDEVDAALDFANATDIFTKLLDLCKSKLVFMVAHSSEIKRMKQITQVIRVVKGEVFQGECLGHQVGNLDLDDELDVMSPIENELLLQTPDDI
jgi:ABC-type multidrug transport system fused ATPase/permease subunit